MAPSQVEHAHFGRPVHLVRDVVGSVALVGQGLEAPCFVFGQPAVDRLAGHVELGRDLGDGETISHHHGHGVVALFHFADVL